MSKLRILGAVALAVLMSAPDAMAQRRGGGGAVRSGVRGAMVGGMVGGSSGAQTGAKVGVVAGATRALLKGPRIAVPWIRKPSRAPNTNPARSTRMLSTRISMKRRRRCWSLPQWLRLPRQRRPLQPATPGGEAIIRKDGKPIVGITYPSDWKQKAGETMCPPSAQSGMPGR